jgi:hypothetical protein
MVTKQKYHGTLVALKVRKGVYVHGGIHAFSISNLSKWKIKKLMQEINPFAD